MKDYKIIDRCLLCNGKIKHIINLGSTPLANEFLDMPEKQDLFPLNLIQCIECNHVQLDCIVDKDRLYKHYLYVSGTSKVNVEHFEKYAREIMFSYYNLATFTDGDSLKLLDLDKNIDKTILDIGSNDGTFLKCFKKYNFDVIGVDPALNIKYLAKLNGIDTITEFFSKDTSKIIRQNLSNKKIKVITCNNMFAHNENLTTIVEGVLELLDDDGIFVFENSYLLDILDKTLVDLIYHEHMHHHHIGALQKFFNKFDMDIYNVTRLPNHGGSIRVFTCRRGTKPIRQSVANIIEEEKSINIKLVQFCDNIKILKETLNNRLKELSSKQKTILVYGMPAKSTTLLYALDIDENLISYGIDDAELKQNTFSPGKHIKIFSDAALKDGSVVLILGWNFADSIISNHPNFKGTWIIPLPELKEFNT